KKRFKYKSINQIKLLKMRHRFLISLLLAVTFFSCKKVVEAPTEYAIHSPSKVNTIIFSIINGKPIYKINHGEKEDVLPSQLGIVFKDNDSLANNLEVIKVNKTTRDETWEAEWGEKHNIQNNCIRLIVELQGKSSTKIQLNIAFRAFDDGVTF